MKLKRRKTADRQTVRQQTRVRNTANESRTRGGMQRAALTDFKIPRGFPNLRRAAEIAQ